MWDEGSELAGSEGRATWPRLLDNPNLRRRLKQVEILGDLLTSQVAIYTM
jgi:hypothetical protein